MKDKHSNSNLANAIHHLKQIGFVVLKHPTKNKYDIHRIGRKEYCESPNYGSFWRKMPDYPFCHNERELIKFAKIYSSENNQNSVKKQYLKSSAKVVRKTRTRKTLQSHDLDKIDELPRIDPKHDDETYWD